MCLTEASVKRTEVHALPTVTLTATMPPVTEEADAELCYAKCLLLRAVLNFVEDETLISLVKGGLKVKTCYSCYRWVPRKGRGGNGGRGREMVGCWKWFVVPSSRYADGGLSGV